MLKAFAAWLARFAGVTPTVEQTRISNGTDAVERGFRWEQFWREEGGMADMIAALRQEAFEAAQEAKANDDVTRHAWMLQDRAYRQLEARIQNVIATGKIEAAKREQVAAVDELNARRRKAF